MWGQAGSAASRNASLGALMASLQRGQVSAFKGTQSLTQRGRPGPHPHHALLTCLHPAGLDLSLGECGTFQRNWTHPPRESQNPAAPSWPVGPERGTPTPRAGVCSGPMCGKRMCASKTLGPRLCLSAVLAPCLCGCREMPAINRAGSAGASRQGGPAEDRLL